MRKQLSLREIQMAELNILVTFDKFCANNGLKYSLVGGTLLGAVRHKGFIPWDDDIDLGMPRPDYDKLYEILRTQNNMLDDYIEMIPDRGECATHPFIKIVDRRISISANDEVGVNNLWIDIFPYDGCPQDEKATKKIFKKAKHYRHIIIYNYFKISQFNGIGKKLLYLLCATYAKIYGVKKAIKNINKLASKYPYESCKKTACVIWGLYGVGERIDREGFDKLTALDFEGYKFSAISNWDEYLSGIYGDYMTLPPENKRNTHSFIAYKAQENNEEVE